MKRASVTAAALLLSLLLTACSSIYDREYVSVEDYVFPSQNETENEDVRIGDITELKSALQALVDEGKTQGKILFAEDYSGNISEDLASACWQVRTGDALCAYCVENISYESTQLLSLREAELRISYSSSVVPFEEIKRLQYSAGMSELIEEAVAGGAKKLAVLVERTVYSSADIKTLANELYRENPAIAPEEPTVTVKLFSGSGSRKLYELTLSYHMSEDTLLQRREELSAFIASAAPRLRGTETERALAALEILLEDFEYDPELAGGNVYEALVGKSSGYEGMALGYAALCREAGLECAIIYGQLNWNDYCWNLVEIEGSWYHVVPGEYENTGGVSGFMMTDEQMWSSYRWDISEYPSGVSGAQ